MDKSYPTYQYSIFLKGSKDEQLVIRADNWEDFVEAKKKADVIIKKVETKPQQPLPITKPDATCAKCGGEMVYREGISKKNNKPYKGYFCKDEKCGNISWL